MRHASPMPTPLRRGPNRPASRPATLFGALLLLVVTAGLVPASSAQEAPDTRVERTPEQVSSMALRLNASFMSPYCPGSSLRDCGSGQAQVLRDRVRGWVAEGRTEAWIRDRMVEEFGESILGAPPFAGFNITLWLMPVAALLAGLALLVHFVRRQQRLALVGAAAPVAGPTDGPSKDDGRREQLERQVEAELRQRQGA